MDYKIVRKTKGTWTWFEIMFHKPSMFNPDRWLPLYGGNMKPAEFMTLHEAEDYISTHYAPIVSEVVKEGTL